MLSMSQFGMRVLASNPSDEEFSKRLFKYRISFDVGIGALLSLICHKYTFIK